MDAGDFWWRERVLDSLFDQFEKGEITREQYEIAVEGF